MCFSTLTTVKTVYISQQLEDAEKSYVEEDNISLEHKNDDEGMSGNTHGNIQRHRYNNEQGEP